MTTQEQPPQDAPEEPSTPERQEAPGDENQPSSEEFDESVKEDVQEAFEPGP